MGYLVWESTKTFAFQRAGAKSLAPHLSFDAVVGFLKSSFPSLHTDVDQERCHFSSPTERRIINVGVDQHKLPEDERGGRH
jgi:hypothetical protein